MSVISSFICCFVFSWHRQVVQYLWAFLGKEIWLLIVYLPGGVLGGRKNTYFYSLHVTSHVSSAAPFLWVGTAPGRELPETDDGIVHFSVRGILTFLRLSVGPEPSLQSQSYGKERMSCICWLSVEKFHGKRKGKQVYHWFFLAGFITFPPKFLASVIRN